MKKYIIGLSLFLLLGCSDNGKYTYKQAKEIMLKKYGQTDVYVCESGFLVNKYLSCFMDNCEIYSNIVENDAGIPTRCTNKVEVKVKETVATGVLSGNIEIKE